MGHILQTIGDDVDDLAFLLERPLHADHWRRHDGPPMPIEDALPEDRVGDASLVLQGDEGYVALARLLAAEHDPRHHDLGAVLAPGKIGPREKKRRVGREDIRPCTFRGALYT